MVPTWTYVKDDDGVYVNLFIGSTIKVSGVAGTDVELVQKTDYPWSGKVAITVNPAEEKKFAVRVRAPNRGVSELYKSTPEANGITSIAVNGSPVPVKIENGYAVIDRTWKAGDMIDVVLPMKVQRVKCDDHVAADAGRVALRYGPLVYSIETADGNNMDAILDPGAPLSTEWRPDLLGGTMVIKGTFADGTPMLAIPNYLRNNRIPAAASAGAGPNSAGSSSAGGDPAARRMARGRSMVWIKDQ
jgi:DUF1680 family protein